VTQDTAQNKFGQAPRISARLAEFSLVAALISVSLIVLPGPRDSEAFAVGREFGFEYFVLVALLAHLTSEPQYDIGSADVALLVFLAFGWASLLQSDVRVLAWRSIGLSTATVGLFFGIRASSSRFRNETLGFLVVVLGAVIASVSWLEAVGWLPRLSEVGRMPGGLFGNRNWMAHVLVLCLPVSLHALIRAKGRAYRILAFATVSLVLGMVILSRSRTAWLGLLAASFVPAIWFAHRFRAIGWSALRPHIMSVLVATGLGVGMVAAVPTVISWRDPYPYRQTLLTLTNVGSGSGYIRVLQQRTTLRMIKDSPFLGVGPGNWQVTYGRYARPGDPSYVPERLVPTNRLPHGDWVGMAAELGIPALATILAFFALTAAELWRSSGDTTTSVNVPDNAGPAIGLATICSLFVMGFSNPIILTPAPAAIAICTIAAWSPPAAALTRYRIRPGSRVLWIAGVVLIFGYPVIVAGRACYGDYLRRTADSVDDLMKAARWNSADFVSRVRISRALVRSGRCDLAIPYALQAYRLFPTSRASIYIFQRCRSVR
jgi:O-antigen ligase